MADTKSNVISRAVPKALDEMNREEFVSIIAESLEQAKQGKTLSVEEACDAIISEIENGTI